MKRLKKSNRVSWASGVKLCQVRLFLSEDCPSRVGVKSQDHLQAKTSWISDSNCVDSDGLPSGFEGRQYVNPLKEKLFHIPQIKWQCPPKFVLNCNWRVAAGEESEEAEAQNHREMRVLEAVYPHHSAIPPSASVSLNVEECDHDDSRIPLIPITPIEEDDNAEDMATPPNASINLQSLALAQGALIPGNPNAPQCNPLASLKPSAIETPALGMLPGLEADVVVAAAATAALTALLKSKEQGSLIDTDLLIKFLSDPKMIEKLINENKPAANTETLPISGLKPSTPSVPLPKPDVVIEKLIDEHGGPVNTRNVPISGSKSLKSLVPLPSSKPDVVKIKKMINEYGTPDNTGNKPPMSSTPMVPVSSPKSDMCALPRPNLHPVQHMVPPCLPLKPPLSPDAVPTTPSFSAMTAPPVKDINYYKSLIKQHGEMQDIQDYNLLQFGKRYNHLQDPKLVHNFEPIELKPKNQKACMYFNSPKGCRNGSNCPYQHDLLRKLRPGSMMEAPGAKKMKLGREITGRT
uniref:Putative zinc finger CCCH domain-containing protein 6-like n=1 Tax=Davidia involucrata TaxID=16924 RepID=A0A5B6ZVB5_DAVIN